VSKKISDDQHVMNVLAVSNPKKNLEGDTSVMTYRGHSVLQTLVRCHFSPEFTTGQRYIYTGCAAGRVVSKYVSVI
jgi:WD repeat-containing protein 23